MVSSLVLRRTKEEMSKQQHVKLPEKKMKTHSIELQEKEREVYQILFEEGRQVREDFINLVV